MCQQLGTNGFMCMCPANCNSYDCSNCLSSKLSTKQSNSTIQSLLVTTAFIPITTEIITITKTEQNYNCSNNRKSYFYICLFFVFLKIKLF
jgi:hypothetical protein